MKSIGVFIAEGFEEIEGLTTVDILRRAGISVTMISISEEKCVSGSHNISILTDMTASEVNFDLLDGIILPGGMPGSNNLLNSHIVVEQVKNFYYQNHLVGAICAAPIVLGHAGILQNKKVCCYPGFEDRLKGATVLNDGVVVDGNIITGRGMGKAVVFSMAILEYLMDKETVDEMKKSIIFGH